tara:strand:- start:889 stop:2076 length:1188 start_codon:yes stop_codon:yes gene_type:complete
MNRIAIFLGIILLFVLLAGGVYFFVLRDTSGTPNNNPSFGSGGSPITIPEDDNIDFVVDDTPIQEKTILTQIHEAPVAGVIVRTNEIEVTVGSTTESVRTPVVQYVDKQTGHVFSYDPEENTAERTSNTTFPGIQDVHWFNDPSKVVFRYVNGDGEIETYLGDLAGGSLNGSYLDVDLPAVQTFNDSLLSVHTTERGSEGFISDNEGRGESLSFESNLLSILVPSFAESFAAVLTKPVSTLAGALYFYENGSQKRILGGINGLTALPNEAGEFVVFSESSDRSYTSALYDRGDDEIKALPLAVLPEKCVWGDETTLYCMVPEIIPPANYPEHWYQGYISFTDSLWRINAALGTARAIAFFDESGPFDGINLSVDEDEDYLTFINRRDGTLWGFDL